MHSFAQENAQKRLLWTIITMDLEDIVSVDVELYLFHHSYEGLKHYRYSQSDRYEV